MNEDGEFHCPHNVDRVMVTRHEDGTFTVDCFDCENQDLKDHQQERLIAWFVDGAE